MLLECRELPALHDESAPILEIDTPAQSDTVLRARLADTELDLRDLFALHYDIARASE